MTKAIVGIIGGSGVYHLPGLEDLREEHVSTPWGNPSDALHLGRIGGTEAVFPAPATGVVIGLAPEGINYRANIDALKQVGVTDLVSVSACGSFKEELSPGTFVVADQFVDRTVGRTSSFFGNGCVAHVSMAHPVAPDSRRALPRCRRGRGHRGRARAAPTCACRGRSSPRSANRSPYKGLGLRRHRHDGDARGQARPRGRALLRDRRDGDGLRLLAPRSRARRRRRDRRRAEGQRGERRPPRRAPAA